MNERKCIQKQIKLNQGCFHIEREVIGFVSLFVHVMSECFFLLYLKYSKLKGVTSKIKFTTYLTKLTDFLSNGFTYRYSWLCFNKIFPTCYMIAVMYGLFYEKGQWKGCFPLIVALGEIHSTTKRPTQRSEFSSSLTESCGNAEWKNGGFYGFILPFLVEERDHPSSYPLDRVQNNNSSTITRSYRNFRPSFLLPFAFCLQKFTHDIRCVD